MILFHSLFKFLVSPSFPTLSFPHSFRLSLKKLPFLSYQSHSHISGPVARGSSPGLMHAYSSLPTISAEPNLFLFLPCICACVSVFHLVVFIYSVILETIVRLQLVVYHFILLERCCSVPRSRRER
ncbi:hypothetical protein K435DRAFT_523490 [Dendrothele bispora CBS 962.96]|uniref:Uncharacterized protein n=1 Tax=Dendrothele bispora (strain CBS 962.96) TaxID=1314807 RepID=A0A4S8KUL7_DENBC|nr:hypothetical protein K435DRAFT_523490 [Dendrothele bispora CBS 962.96]